VFSPNFAHVREEKCRQRSKSCSVDSGFGSESAKGSSDADSEASDDWDAASYLGKNVAASNTGTELSTTTSMLKRSRRHLGHQGVAAVWGISLQDAAELLEAVEEQQSAPHPSHGSK
jgi:hypothetical protein